MSRMNLALGASVGLHGTLLAALILFANAVAPPAEPPKGFRIAMAPPRAAVEPAAPLSPPEVEAPVPSAEAPLAPDIEVPVVTATEPKPPAKPKPRSVPVPREPEEPPQTGALPPQPNAVPAPEPAPAAPDPQLAASYRAELSAWFESHKRYPDSAREKSEQGTATVSFRVDPAGHVLQYGLLKGTGYADLDQSVVEMMSGAKLPAFPPGLNAPHLDVSVTLRFSMPR